VACQSGGIGSASALLLASKGCSIAAAYNSSDVRVKELVETIKTEHDVPVRAFQADLSNYDGPGKLYADVKAAMGEPDILFANHGGASKLVESIQEVDLETLETTWRMNFATSFEVRPAGKGDLKHSCLADMASNSFFLV
jgi:3-oxoacyl-[acyl-carrier protein] reductase